MTQTSLQYSDFILVKHSDGLIPVVVQDKDSLQILTIGYMNQTAFEKTKETGLVTFWSRTRQRLHVRGEHSGHYMHVHSYSTDHRHETLLLAVSVEGEPDYEKKQSVFQAPRSLGYTRKLEQKIKRRHSYMPEGSYTTHLFEKGKAHIVEKLAGANMRALSAALYGKREDYLSHIAEQCYLSIVLLEEMGYSLADVEALLSERYEHKQSHRK